MAKPTKLPEVASTNVTLPTAGTDNKLEPTTTIKQVGWDQSQKPAAQNFNWLFNNIYDWVVHLDSEADAFRAFETGVGGSDAVVRRSQIPLYLSKTDIECQTASVVIQDFSFADKVDNYLFQSSGTLIKLWNTTGTWAEGTSGNIRPSAVSLAADTAYYLFAIAKDDGTVDVGVDDNATATNLLAAATGYTRYRRIGWVMTKQASSTTLVEYEARGDNFSIDNVTDMMRTWTASVTSTNTKTSAPPNTLCDFLLTGHSSADRYFICRSKTTGDVAPDATNHTCNAQSDGAGSVSALNAHHRLRVDGSSEIAIRASATSNVTARNVVTLGWTDERMD